MYIFWGIISVIDQTLDRLRSVHIFLYAVPVQTSARSILGMDYGPIQFLINLNIPDALTFGIRRCFNGPIEAPGYNI